MAITEKRLGEILDDKFKTQNTLLETTLKPHEEARVQVWKNKDDITTMKTEHRTNRLWFAAIYSTINAVIALITALFTLKIFGGK